MIKVWWLMWYFTRYDGPTDASVPFWYDGTMSKGRLHWYLVFNKNYREDVRDTIERWVAYFFGLQISRPKNRDKRIKKRFKEIYDTIDKAIDLGYLIASSPTPYTFPDDIRLSCNYRGRDFLKPHYFIEACAREFGYIASVTASFLVGVGGTSIVLSWGHLINFLAGLL
jgi:hypothetical protein